MLEFRKIDYSQDLDQIIKLIHKNLDPNFTIALFKWKHLENPFGRSYGLLAIDGDKIVGLRMFMYWKFFNPQDGGILNAIRPVDTVVDSHYRGQGLFKRLTLTGLDECRENYEFIFNTPNENSFPGYLKMGWEKLDQNNYFKIGVVNPLTKNIQFEDVGPNLIKLPAGFQNTSGISTYKTLEYFRWRYQDKRYKIAYFPSQDAYIVYSIDKSMYLIVYEFIGDFKTLSGAMLNSMALKIKKPLIYYYNRNGFENVKFLLARNRNKPVIVLKNYEKIKQLNHFDFSLADLEAVF